MTEADCVQVSRRHIQVKVRTRDNYGEAERDIWTVASDSAAPRRALAPSLSITLLIAGTELTLL